jgi:hypothetical protein
MSNRNDRTRDESPLRPIGVALAAVVAGIGIAKGEAVQRFAPSEPFAPQDSRARMHVVDHTNHADFERDDSLFLGPSEAVEPFSETAQAPKRQGDLFDL